MFTLWIGATAALVATTIEHAPSFPEPNQACVTKDFGGHTCPSSCSGMTDISSSSITTSAECIAACCADPKIKVCTYAGFQDATKTCIAGDWQPCPSCRKSAGWTTTLINFGAVPQNGPVSATLGLSLTPGTTITGVSFAYQYETGYKGTVGANFTLDVAGTAAYSAPTVNNYPYSKSGGSSAYSPAVNVASKGLSIAVPSSGGGVAFNFHNIDRNIQLELPMTIKITCTGSSACFSGPAPPPPPPGAKLLPHFFDSNMVLQREPQSAVIHGYTASSGEKVTVQMLTGKTWTTTAASDGTWSISLDPQPASTGATIKVSTSGGKSQTLANVAFGDVFLCSGNNMAFSPNLAFNATAEIADSINYPNIRMFTGEDVMANSPAQDLLDIQHSKVAAGVDLGPYANSTWAASAPDAFVGPTGPYFTWPSAICYFYGRDLYKGLGGKVPVGLVASSWGGEPIEPFMSADALADQTCGGTKPAAAPEPVHPSTLAAAPAPAMVGDGGGTIWNGIIAPLTKMRYAGMVWYQGESNDNEAV
eukprot:gene12061-11421_t